MHGCITPGAATGADVAGLLLQLAPGAGQDVLAGVDLAGGQLQKGPAQRVAELPLEDQRAVLAHRDHHHRARVPDVFAQASPAVGQAHLVPEHMQELAVENLLGGLLFFVQGSCMGRSVGSKDPKHRTRRPRLARPSGIIRPMNSDCPPLADHLLSPAAGWSITCARCATGTACGRPSTAWSPAGWPAGSRGGASW
jgi:hypothetical protein